MIPMETLATLEALFSSFKGLWLMHGLSSYPISESSLQTQVTLVRTPIRLKKVFTISVN